MLCTTVSRFSPCQIRCLPTCPKTIACTFSFAPKFLGILTLLGLDWPKPNRVLGSLGANGLNLFTSQNFICSSQPHHDFVWPCRLLASLQDITFYKYHPSSSKPLFYMYTSPFFYTSVWNLVGFEKFLVHSSESKSMSCGETD